MQSQAQYPSSGICPVCGGPATQQPSEQTHGQLVNCDGCGPYRIEIGALTGLEEQRYLLAGLLRRASQTSDVPSTGRLTLTQESVRELLSSSRLPESLLDQLDLTLEYARKLQLRADQFIEYGVHAKTDYVYAFARDTDEFLHFFRTLSSQGLLDEPPGRDSARRTAFRITPPGWQRLREIARTSHDSNRAFVAMWFSTEMDSAWQNGIKPALTSLSYVPLRIDLTHSENKIDDRIIAEIRRSGLIVADFTGNSGGVYFEAGLALGLGIPVVWTCRRDYIDKTHFDTRQYQHLVWDNPEDLKQKLVNHIAARIPGRMLKE